MSSVNFPSSIPEVTVTPEISKWIIKKCAQFRSLEEIEHAVLYNEFSDPFLTNDIWNKFLQDVLKEWYLRDYVVLRKIPFVGDGASAILASLVLAQKFRPYRTDKIIKHFKMSPWTTSLSHTIQAGHFHTDLNTKEQPPKITGIQCRIPDPNAPKYGINRVARLTDILNNLKLRNDLASLHFLTETPVTMVSDTELGEWTGHIVCNGTIRFHPETLRAAWKRSGQVPNEEENILMRVQDAAMDVSVPINLERGDILFVSNTRALHWRGECTVEFIEFPRHFRCREIHVLHLMDEPINNP